MKTSFNFLLLISLISAQIQAQVGINTTEPSPGSQLDINGKVVIRDYSRSSTGVSGVKAVFAEADGTLIGVNIPSSMIEEGSDNDLSLVPSSSTGGPVIEKLVLINQQFNTQNNWDIDLDGDNSDVSTIIVRKESGGNELKIRGIVGGTEGRKIRIINDSGKKIKFEEDHSSASNGNKIYIYTEDKKIEEYGSCILIYSTAISDDGHWNLVQMDQTD